VIPNIKAFIKKKKKNLLQKKIKNKYSFFIFNRFFVILDVYQVKKSNYKIIPKKKTFKKKKKKKLQQKKIKKKYGRFIFNPFVLIFLFHLFLTSYLV